MDDDQMIFGCYCCRCHCCNRRLHAEKRCDGDDDDENFCLLPTHVCHTDTFTHSLFCDNIKTKKITLNGHTDTHTYNTRTQNEFVASRMMTMRNRSPLKLSSECCTHSKLTHIRAHTHMKYKRIIATIRPGRNINCQIL